MNLKNLNRSTKSNIITFGIVIGFYLLIQILSAAGMVTNSFAGQLVPICAYVVMAVSLNLTVGMLGELSLGHAGFMSVGAFAGTLVWVSLYDTTFPKPAALLLAFVVGGVVAGIFGFLVGIPVLRLSGDYLAIVTLAFGEIVKNFMNACNLGVDSKGLHFSLKDTASLNLDADGKVLINGAMGITGIKKASTFTIGIVLVIITLAVILNLVNSRAGRAITSIRDNEIAARSVGLGAGKLRTVFTIVLPSAMPGILSGVILATGRIVGETAALIYTASSMPQIPKSIFSSTRTLAVHMYQLSNEGLYINETYGTAVVLLVLVLAINCLSGFIAGKLAKK